MIALLGSPSMARRSLPSAKLQFQSSQKWTNPCTNSTSASEGAFDDARRDASSTRLRTTEGATSLLIGAAARVKAIPAQASE